MFSTMRIAPPRMGWAMSPGRMGASATDVLRVAMAVVAGEAGGGPLGAVDDEAPLVESERGWAPGPDGDAFPAAGEADGPSAGGPVTRSK